MGKIFDSLNKFVDDNYIFFTTPGHKQGKAYDDIKDLFKYDLTEVDGLDNLHDPYECIKDSLEELKEFYDSYKSYYLLNGSTSGIHIMIFSAFNENDKIIIERGCHKSLINACILRKLNVFYLDSEKYKIDLLMPEFKSFINYNKEDMLLEDINDLIRENADIKGVFLTNPNYYGIYFNQEKIYKYLKNRSILFFIDGAHGAHIRAFNKKIPCINKFCDGSVMSAHKTLSAFTQGAYLHINNSDLCKNSDMYFSIFTTTSPSYMIMLSLEKSLRECQKYIKLEDVLTNKLSLLKNKLENTRFDILSKDYIVKKTRGNLSYDDSRICIKFKFGDINSNILYKYLFDKKIVCEMSFFNGLVLIPTVYNDDEDFEMLYNFLCNFSQYGVSENNILDIIPSIYSIKNEKVLNPYEVLNRNYKFVEISKSVGEILFSDVFLYPPGSPIIVRGEKILKEHVDLIEEYLRLGYKVNGIFNNNFKVIDGR